MGVGEVLPASLIRLYNGLLFHVDPGRGRGFQGLKSSGRLHRRCIRLSLAALGRGCSDSSLSLPSSPSCRGTMYSRLPMPLALHVLLWFPVR